MIQTVDYNDEEYYLIINPTMNCNFDCWYCYETHEKQSRVSDISLNKMKLFISNIIHNNKELKKFTVQFFGGEPLLYYKKTVLPLLKYLNKEVNNKNINLLINFTTNGYLINDEMINDFVQYKVNAFQITFDGNKEKHDSVRYVSKNKGSYDKIVKNVKKLVKNNFGVTLRVNYTEKNLVDLDNILDSFIDLSINEKSRIMLSLKSASSDLLNQHCK